MEDIILSSTLVDRSRGQLRLPSAFVSKGSVLESEPRLIVLQLNVRSNSSTEISFSVGEKKPIRGNGFSKLLEQRTKGFNSKFEAVYGLSAKV
ncbi:unnamed protein product [Brugia timori]|uniref:SpoVT-AbrB domain-containing protein n=1 Tax=Brugia timori TaxID=42155 RepID=A0A0R3QGB6_9BILA|nr:unnamed protein product [Brugia timori]